MKFQYLFLILFTCILFSGVYVFGEQTNNTDQKKNNLTDNSVKPQNQFQTITIIPEPTDNKKSNDQSLLSPMWVIVYVTMTGIGITTYYQMRSNRLTRISNDLTKTSNDLLTKEMKIKIRPWITFLEPMPVFVIGKNSSIPYDDYAKAPTSYTDTVLGISFSMDVRNIGTMPCKKISFRIWENSIRPTRDDLITKGKTGVPFPLAPQERVAFKFLIPTDDWNVRHVSAYHFGFYIEYEIEKGKTCKIGKIWSARAGGTGMEDYWTHDDLLD